MTSAHRVGSRRRPGSRRTPRFRRCSTQRSRTCTAAMSWCPVGSNHTGPRGSAPGSRTLPRGRRRSSDFRYTVQAPGGVDVNANLGRHIFEGEAEIAFTGGIDRRFVEGGDRVHDNSLGEWSPNLYFDPSP